VGNAAPYVHLVHHLCAVLLEEYALRRLENRQFGETTSKRISVIEGESSAGYAAEQALEIDSEGGIVHIAARAPFALLPALFQSASASRMIHHCLDRASRLPTNRCPLVLMPMDVVYGTSIGIRVGDLFRDSKTNWLVIGQTMAQLVSEVEQKLAIAAVQIDENEVDASNVDRHTD
jgi:hypothetical protein